MVAADGVTVVVSRSQRLELLNEVFDQLRRQRDALVVMEKELAVIRNPPGWEGDAAAARLGHNRTTDRPP